MSNLKCKSMKKNRKSNRQRCLKYVALLLFFYPITLLGAQGVISVKGQAMTIKQAIQLIEESSNYTFFYNAVDLKNTVNKNLNCEGTIEEVLKEVFKGSGISYMIKGDEVILKVDKTETVQQSKKKRTVIGTVTDAENGEPIIGATILIKGQKEGVITDIDGNFTISVSDIRSQIEISYIGYRKKTVDISDLGVVNVKLESDNQMLNEVVVVGAGTQKKVSVTGSITSIKGMELKAPSSSLTNSFAGKLAGVISMSTSGEPGSASEFYIRGVSTFGGRATPLIMLDDVEISSADLNRLPPEIIESFSILKDASATAIYGARGANGVMLIKTKDGNENERTKISVTLENSFNQPMNFPSFVNGATWMEMYNEASTTRNHAATPKYSQEAINATRKHLNPYVYPDVDWSDLIFRNLAINQRANLTIQGGNSKATYFMSVQANHDTGLIESPKIYSFDNNINNWGFNFQNNITYKVTPSTKVELRINAQIQQGKGPSYSTGDLFKLTYSANPVYFPAYFPAEEGDSHVRFGNMSTIDSGVRTNPYAYMVSSFKESSENTINASLKLTQQLDFITKGLSVNGLLNFKNWSSSYFTRTITPYYYKVKADSYDMENPTSYETEMIKEGTNYLATSDYFKSGDYTIYMQFALNYGRQFGLHNVGAMLLYTQREYRNSVLPNRLQGFSGRATYDYGQRYLFEFNFGYNGSERMAKGNRFEFFPAVSLGWVISNEEFFKPFSRVVDNLKIRGSYGLVGSDETGSNLTDVPHFLYIDNISLTGGGGFTTGMSGANLNMNGPIVNQYAVQNAGWERAKKLDLGVDLTLFRNWNITFDYFRENRYNILLHREAWPESLGYYTAKPWSNLGKVRNSGIEFSTTYRQAITKDFSMEVRGNFTYTANKYIEADEPKYDLPWLSTEGRPLSYTYGYIAEGLFQSQDEIDHSPLQDFGSTPQVGDIKYKDINGDNIIDTDDQMVISQYGGTPRIQYGFGLNLFYKKFDFGMFFNGSAKRTLMISGIHPFGTGDNNIFQFIADDYWTESNPNANAKYPRLGLLDTETSNNKQNSTYWMRNGNFIRFKTLELGYTFKYGRAYFNCDNVAVFSPFKHWDPELAWYAYPLQRTFNLGIQLHF